MELLHNPVLRERRAPPGGVSNHPGAYRRMSAHRELNRSRRLPQFPMHQRDIRLMYVPILKGMTQARVSNIVLRDDQQPGSLLIQTMNDAWTGCATRIRQLLKMIKKSMNNGGAVRSGPGMDHQSC